MTFRSRTNSFHTAEVFRPKSAVFGALGSVLFLFLVSVLLLSPEDALKYQFIVVYSV